MRLLIFSESCSSRVHCSTCRSLEGGRWLREAWRKNWELPDGEVDFACPHGLPWGYVPPSRGVGDTFAKVVKVLGIPPCGGCKKRQTTLNKLLPYPDKNPPANNPPT